MKVMVLDKKVRHNLSLFKHLIHRQAEKIEKHFQTAKKSYHAFINCHTGELRFVDLEGKIKLSEDWKKLVIQLRPGSEGAFEVLGNEGNSSFDCSELDHEAYVMLTKTLHILNQLSYDPIQGRNPFWILRHVAHIDFLLSEAEEGQRNLIHDAWYNIDRFHAEYLLANMPPGTYLFRKDEYTQVLEDSLNEERSLPVSCITLSYRDWEEKICEKILVYCDEQWLFYNDDPSLSGPRFNSVKELLHSLGEVLARPLWAS